MKKLLVISAIALGLVGVASLGGKELADPPSGGGFRTYDPPTTTEPTDPTEPEPTGTDSIVDPIVELTETIL